MNSEVRVVRWIVLLLAGWSVALAHAAQVSVAVAANMLPPMQLIAAAFQRDTGHQAVLVSGSTGKFHAQVRNGAPFHLLLAADTETPARLAAEGFAVGSTRFTYAIGRLVLWSAQAGVVDAGGEVLRSDTRSRLAIADPRVAPYGAAAMDALRALKLEDRWRPRLVQGESIGQAFQFVASGNARLGLVALSQVTKEGRLASGSGWVVPSSLHTPIRQDAVVLSAGRDHPAAHALLDYLRTDRARAVLRAHGYELP